MRELTEDCTEGLTGRELKVTISEVARLLESGVGSTKTNTNQHILMREQAVELAAAYTGGQLHLAAPWVIECGCIWWFVDDPGSRMGCCFDVRHTLRAAALWIWHEGGPVEGTPEEPAPRESLVGSILRATSDRFPIWWVRSKTIEFQHLFFETNPREPAYAWKGAKRLLLGLEEVERYNAGRYPALTGLHLYLRAVLPSGSRRTKARRLAKLLLGVS